MLFGEYEAIEVGTSEGRTTPYGFGQAQPSTTYTRSEEYAKRQSVLESEMFMIPPTSPETGLTGYYLVPGVGAYKHNYPGKWLFGSGLAAIADDVEDVKLRPPGEQWLGAWDESDAQSRKLIDPPLEETTDATAEESADYASKLEGFRARKKKE